MPTFTKQRSSNPTPSGIPQGTMGGRSPSAGSRPGARSLLLGEDLYLWALLIIEVVIMGALRQRFRRYHGG